MLFNCERRRGGLIAKIHVTNAVLKSHQAGKSHSGSGKSPQERRNTMAQPVSSVTGDLVNPIGMDVLYRRPASRDQIKPLLVQPQISCNAHGLAVANLIGRAMI